MAAFISSISAKLGQGAAMSQVVPESASSLHAELRTLIASSLTKGKKAP